MVQPLGHASQPCNTAACSSGRTATGTSLRSKTADAKLNRMHSDLVGCITGTRLKRRDLSPRLDITAFRNAASSFRAPSSPVREIFRTRRPSSLLLRPAMPDSVQQSRGKANRKRTLERLVLCVHGAGLLCCELENPEQLHRTVDGRLISSVICTWVAGIRAGTRILGEALEAVRYIRLPNFLEHQAESKIPDRIVQRSVTPGAVLAGVEGFEEIGVRKGTARRIDVGIAHQIRLLGYAGVVLERHRDLGIGLRSGLFSDRLGQGPQTIRGRAGDFYRGGAVRNQNRRAPGSAIGVCPVIV